MNANQINSPATRKGVIPRLFGVVLIFVGILDAMLSWRAAVAVENFYLILVVLGLVFYAIGGIRRRQGETDQHFDRGQVTASPARVKPYKFREGSDL